MSKKIIMYAIGILVTVSTSFFAGYAYSARGIKALAENSDKLSKDIEAERRRAESIARGLRQAELQISTAEQTVSELRRRNTELEESNKRAAERIGSISGEVGEVGEGLSGLIDRLGYYIEQGEE